MKCKRCQDKGYIRYSLPDKHGHFKPVYFLCPDCEISTPVKYCQECENILIFDEEIETGLCDSCYHKLIAEELQEERNKQADCF